jgi:hypothetical protein
MVGEGGSTLLTSGRFPSLADNVCVLTVSEERSYLMTALLVPLLFNKHFPRPQMTTYCFNLLKTVIEDPKRPIYSDTLIRTLDNIQRRLIFYDTMPVVNRILYGCCFK